MLERASERCRDALERARQHALRFRHTRIGTSHLLLGLLDEGAGVGTSTLRHLGVEVKVVRAEIESRLQPGAGVIGRKAMPFDEECRAALAAAVGAAKERNSPYVGTEHLLLGLLADAHSFSARVLDKFGITHNDAAAAAAELKADPQRPASARAQDSRDRKPRSPRLGPTSQLDTIAVDLANRTQRRQLRPVCGRFAELERIKHLLSQEPRTSVFVLGKSGVGKTSAVFALARDILIGSVPSALLGKRMLAIDPVRLAAGCRHKDQLEQRVDEIVAQAERARDVILVFDDAGWLLNGVHDIHDHHDGHIGHFEGTTHSLQRGREARDDAPAGLESERPSNPDVTDMFARFRPALEARRLQAILTLAPNGEPDAESKLLRANFGDWFECVSLFPADIDRTLMTVYELREQLENHHRVTITEDALKTAVQLAVSAGDKNDLLTTALRLVDETGARLTARAFTPPVRATKLVREIEKLEAARSEAFERKDHSDAARRFDEARANRELLEQIERRWRTELREKLRVVDETAIAETWSIHGGYRTAEPNRATPRADAPSFEPPTEPTESSKPSDGGA